MGKTITFLNLCVSIVTTQNFVSYAFKKCKTKLAISKTGLLIIFLIICNISIVNAQNCNDSIEAKRNKRAIDNDGTYYKVLLKNSSFKNTTYSLSYVYDDNCSKSTKSNYQSNIPLKISFSEINQQDIPIVSVSLASNTEKIILVKVLKKNNAPVNLWTCFKVIAKNNSCNNNSSVTLQALITTTKE